MAVSYKLYQNKSEKSLYKGKWYARAVVNGVVNLNEMADTAQLYGQEERRAGRAHRAGGGDAG